MQLSKYLAGISRKVYVKIAPTLVHGAKWCELAEALDELSRRYYKDRQNWCYKIADNGERWLLKQLADAKALHVVFDVGANIGGYAREVLEANSKAQVHCFEICQPTFDKLYNSLGSEPNISFNDFGLSDQVGTVAVQYCAERDTLSSTVTITNDVTSEVLECKVRTGADYCREKNLQKIDLLKIDVEGSEFSVLSGFGDLLNPETIRVIQFEYGLVNIRSRSLLADFYKLLRNKGYLVGKLFPTHVKFKDYEFTDEDFLGPNYIAATQELVPTLTKQQL